MSLQTVKTMVPLAMLYFVRDLDAEDPEVFTKAAVFFAATMSVVLGSWLYLLRLTSQSGDKSVIKVTEKDLQQPNPLGDALAQKLDPSRAQQEEKEMTVGEYDKAQVMQKLKQAAMQTLIVGGVSYRWVTVLPMLLSSVTAVLAIPDDPIFRIYLRGHTEEDDPELKRPFKAKSPFADIMAQYEEAKKASEREAAEEDTKKGEEKEAKKDK